MNFKMSKNKKIYIAGHTGLVGSAILNHFKKLGCSNLLLRTIDKIDLRDQLNVEKLFKDEKPEYVIIAAAKVGGINANNIYRAEFLYDNLMIEANLIHSAYRYGVEKLIFLGSSCIYPKLAQQPLKEEYLLSNYLEYTNEPYAIAKIAGVKLCENYYKQYGCNFYSVMPTNMYGPNDNFNLMSSHVLPALLRKFHDAKINNTELVEVWGSGKPLREFMHVDDLAEAIYFLLDNINAKDIYENNITHLNIGTGEDISIAGLAMLIKKIIGYEGKIDYDRSKPDGTPRKLLDVSRIHKLGWKHKIGLEEGIRKTYEWFVSNYK